MIFLFRKFWNFEWKKRLSNIGKMPGFYPNCAKKAKFGRPRIYPLFLQSLLILGLLAGCASWEDFEDGDDYGYTGESQEKRGPGSGGPMSRGGGMAPQASMIEQMRSSRMASLNQTPGMGASGGVSKSTIQRSSQSSQYKQPKEDTRILKAGIEAYNIGDYNGAVEKLKNFVDHFPASDSTPEAHFFLGESYYRMKEYQKALTNYKKIDSNFSLYPRAGEALYKAGKCLEAMGNEKLAKRVYKKVTAKYPSFKPDSIKD